jgi:nifR3 family TIM-barrel protein
MLKSLKIGALALPHNVVLAPLAGITNLPFRILCRREGAALAFTEMVSVNGLVREGIKTRALLKSLTEDRPLGIQLFGDTPLQLAEAARMVEGCGDLLDINMGCPVRKVVGTGAGSALLKEPGRIAEIVRAVRAVTRLPLTIKIRSGWHCGDNIHREIGRIAESEGCDAITLHPRSRSQMFSGQAAWDQLGELKQSVSIPVIGSGDLFSADDCLRMLKETGCDGIMIARGALGAPWIFRQVAELAATGKFSAITPVQRAEAIRQHLQLFCDEFGEAVAVREMKKHIGWYARGFAGAADVRRAANGARSLDDLGELIERIAAVCDE